MTKKDIVSAATAMLRERDVRKPVTVKKHSLTILDPDGHKAAFDVKQQDKMVIYTMEDVSIILDACLEAIEDCLRRGEEVAFRGFGMWRLHYRKARHTKDPFYGREVDVAARYVPKFIFGTRLRMAARSYELMLEDAENAPKLPDPVYDEDDI